MLHPGQVYFPLDVDVDSPPGGQALGIRALGLFPGGSHPLELCTVRYEAPSGPVGWLSVRWTGKIQYFFDTLK